MNYNNITTLKALKASGYTSKTVKQELRDNLIKAIRNKQNVFEKVLGYENTVIPEVERAILAGHNMNLLGLRGQAKTSIARAMVNLLDEYMPAIAGTELHDDPFNPITYQGKSIVAELGDETPIIWVHRNERYTEKLATPDVTVADLIGDVDPIKAANLKLAYSDERVIHFGLVAHAHRGLFVINELPDLQPRIQVALFNILQEGDIQIRGFKIRLPLDVHFIFTANPEDYTSRGSIITPLKDRIQSQIITHYPKSLAIAKEITKQEVRLSTETQQLVRVPSLLEDLLETVVIEARSSEYIDQKSGVSARLSISAYENLVASAERRAILNNQTQVTARVIDLYSIIPAITGKVELVYEGEQEGSLGVAYALIAKAIRVVFPSYFPNPEVIKRKKLDNPYIEIIQWFGANELTLLVDESDEQFNKQLDKVTGLKALAHKHFPTLQPDELYLVMEFILHGLAEYSLVNMQRYELGLGFSDLLGSMFKGYDLGEE